MSRLVFLVFLVRVPKHHIGTKGAKSIGAPPSALAPKKALSMYSLFTFFYSLVFNIFSFLLLLYHFFITAIS